MHQTHAKAPLEMKQRVTTFSMALRGILSRRADSALQEIRHLPDCFLAMNREHEPAWAAVVAMLTEIDSLPGAEA